MSHLLTVFKFMNDLIALMITQKLNKLINVITGLKSHFKKLALVKFLTCRKIFFLNKISKLSAIDVNFLKKFKPGLQHSNSDYHLVTKLIFFFLSISLIGLFTLVLKI